MHIKVSTQTKKQFWRVENTPEGWAFEWKGKNKSYFNVFTGEKAKEPPELTTEEQEEQVEKEEGNDALVLPGIKTQVRCLCLSWWTSSMKKLVRESTNTETESCPRIFLVNSDASILS